MTTVPMLPNPTGPGELARHLIDMHAMPATVVDEGTAAEHAVWHAGEHRTRLDEFLCHRHPKSSADHAEVIDPHLQDLTRRARRHAGATR